ncbi:hypothetical protein BDV30DRAFT_205205, partial [Aspergillus minisclerotigenes]
MATIPNRMIFPSTDSSRVLKSETPQGSNLLNSVMPYTFAILGDCRLCTVQQNCRAQSDYM